MTRALRTDLLTPEAVVAHFAEAGIDISERELRKRARKLRACRQIGKAMFLTVADVDRIIDAAVPPEEDTCQNSASEATPGTILSQSPESAFEQAQRRLIGKRPRTSPSNTKPGSVVPLSMARKRN